MIQFNNVILHNFGSYNHAEINLQNRGFCLVTGENNFKNDNASSNGSGKSFIWSGICFAITGQTIQGLKSNLKNIYNEEKEAYVALDFIVDGIHYYITRYLAPKSDLKIIKDGTDVSGKGIRESEEKLAELLPELTQDLIASTIIIGQGMPNKFSAFKPSGRKELLEKLTKSDFMIEDIKTRITNRASELATKAREIEDALIAHNTKLSTYNTSLTAAKNKVASVVKPDFDAEIKALTERMAAVQKDIDTTTESITKTEAAVEKANVDLLAKTAEKTTQTKQLYEKYTAATAGLKTKKVELETQKRAAETKLNQFRENPDRCPTCHQVLPDANHILQEKANTEAEVKTLTEQLNTTLTSLANADAHNAEYTKQINDAFDTDIAQLTANATKLKSELFGLKNNLNDFSHYYNLDKENLIKITAAKDSWDREQADIATTIAELETAITKLTTAITETSKAKAEIEEHLTRIKWLDTISKRDFRGFILTDIIKYLDTKAKAYTETVFGTKDLNIYLDGNDLDITYGGKMFDNLSGGEKTRVDLIIQFAIRDLLTAYMNAGSNILVLDEVTDFLDAQSCEAVMAMLEKELSTVESVFIISHHSDELGLPVDTELHVCKGADGISTVYQK